MNKWELLRKHIEDLAAMEKAEFEKTKDPEAEYGLGLFNDLLNKMDELDGEDDA